MAYHNKSLFPPISEQLNSTPATEFIDLYRNTISILENRNERLGQEVSFVMKSVRTAVRQSYIDEI